MRRNFANTELICTDCGMIMPIIRKKCKQKKVGHIKHMYCPKCKDTRAFTEMKVVDKNLLYWENMFMEEVEDDGSMA